MSISTTCTNCGARISLAADLAGGRVRCSRCGATIQKPTVAAPKRSPLPWIVASMIAMIVGWLVFRPAPPPKPAPLAVAQPVPHAPKLWDELPPGDLAIWISGDRAGEFLEDPAIGPDAPSECRTDEVAVVFADGAQLRWLMLLRGTYVVDRMIRAYELAGLRPGGDELRVHVSRHRIFVGHRELLEKALEVRQGHMPSFSATLVHERREGLLRFPSGEIRMLFARRPAMQVWGHRVKYGWTLEATAHFESAAAREIAMGKVRPDYGGLIVNEKRGHANRIELRMYAYLSLVASLWPPGYDRWRAAAPSKTLGALTAWIRNLCEATP